MPRATRHYRLRIRSADDSSDALILTSVPGGTNPYLTGPPQGDGQEIDPATGESSIGAYTIEAADVSEIITAALVDGDGRQTLIQRRAYLELSTDVGSTFPTVLVPGFVNAYRLVTPMRWAFTIGESRRIEYTRKVWDRTTDNFEQATCLIGGPFRGDWGPIAGRGDGWRFEVIDTDATTVTLRVLFGWFPIDGSTPGYQFGITPYARIRANNLASAEEVLIETAANTATYPGIVVLVETENGTEVDRFTALAQELGPQLSHVILLNDDIKLLRAGTAWGGTPPSNGTIFRVYAWRTTIGEDNPLHIYKHPIDILTDLWDETGIAYDSTEATTVRELLGDNNRLRLRIREPWVLRDVEQMIGGLFGVVTRVGTDGELELITTRIRGVAAPSSLYDDDDLRSPDTVIFEVDESTIYNNVTVEQLQFRQWGAGMGDRPADDIVAQRRVQFFDLDSDGDGTPDSDTFGVRELRFTVPGTVLSSVSGWGLGDVYFEKGLATEVFERFGRGGVYGTVAALPAITEKVGQEIRLDVSHLPNAGVRGGERIMQIVRRTETPSGPSLLLLDSGPNSQFATAPTFSLAAGAADGRKYVDITVTNAAALNTAGAWLRVEWDVAGSEPSAGSVLTQYMAGKIPTSFTTPAVDAGSHIWMRMQAFIPGKRPTAYTAWQDVDLTDLTAPSNLSRSAGSDPARITITFTPGESDIPLEVFQRPQGDPANEAVVVDRLPPGSDRVTLTLEPGSSYTIGIRYREQADFSGVSSTTEISFTVAGSPDTLPAPTQVFALGTKWSVGSLGGVWPDDTADHYAVGLRVRSAIEEGFVEFEMARETAVGSGTPGSYSLLERRSVIGVDETYIFTVGVALDGKLRYLRARHARVGATASAYTTVVNVMPGDILSPPPPVNPIEITGVVPVTLGGTEIADPTLGVLLVGAGSSAMTQLAPGAAGGYARSSGSAWVRSSGVAAADLTGTVASARLSGVYSGITGLGTQAQALDMGTNNITNVGTITSSGMSIESGSPVITLKDTNNVLGDVAYSSYIRGTDSADAQAWWLGDGQSGVKQASFWATTGYALGLYSNDTLVLMLSDSSTLATFSGAVSMGALTAATGTFSGDVILTGNQEVRRNATNGYLILAGGNAGNDGGNILLHGSTETNAKDIQFRSGGSDVGRWDDSESLWIFGGSVSMGALTASGIVHAQGGRLEVGTAASGGLNNLQLWDAGTYFRIQSFEGLPLVINSLGNNVLIGTTTDAGFKLDVNGTARTGALTVTGKINTSVNSDFLDASGTSTSARAMKIANTTGFVIFGVESSAGGNMMAGSTGYATVLTTVGATVLQLGGNQTLACTFDGADTILAGDLTIGSLGTFDSTSAPSTDFILRYNGSKWVSAYLHTQFFAGDGVSQINGDGTTSAFVYSNPSLSGAPSPNPSVAPVITASHKSIKIDMSAYTLGATETFVLEYSIDGGAYTGNAIVSTGTQVVHATLTPGSTYAYKYKIRGGTATPFSPASSAINPLNDSSAQTFGIVLAAQVVATNLAAISADIGIITAGQMRDSTNVYGINLGGAGGIPGGWNAGINFENTAVDGMNRYVNFYEGASGGLDSFIKHELFDLKHDGTALFQGQLDITSAQVVQTLANFHIVLRDPDVAHGMTSLVDTDVLGTIGFQGSLVGGLNILGFHDDADGPALLLQGVHADASPTSCVDIECWVKSGTTRIAPTGNVMMFRVRAGQTNKLTFSSDGDMGISGKFYPGGLVDLADDLEFAERTIALSAGANNNLDTGTVTIQRLQSAGGVANITGLAGGRAGRVVMLYNYSSNTITLNHNNGGSLSANRMILPGEANIVLTQGSGATLVYDTAVSRWRCVSKAV
ncbi:hypothetical protein LCGC14_0746150 [marine sediment metagenome]|uniref:Fibronectin type-III domain-containing protein n=1 Tax=marine sediment metagenome TaxID=412755 RepID=A0A0F9Q589_9ZZZZ